MGEPDPGRHHSASEGRAPGATWPSRCLPGEDDAGWQQQVPGKLRVASPVHIVGRQPADQPRYGGSQKSRPPVVSEPVHQHVEGRDGQRVEHLTAPQDGAVCRQARQPGQEGAPGMVAEMVVEGREGCIGIVVAWHPPGVHDLLCDQCVMVRVDPRRIRHAADDPQSHRQSEHKGAPCASERQRSAAIRRSQRATQPPEHSHARRDQQPEDAYPRPRRAEHARPQEQHREQRQAQEGCQAQRLQGVGTSQGTEDEQDC